MPNFWSTTMEFEITGDSFRVSAKPHGIHGDEWLSWIPYRTGNKFTAQIEVTRLSGNSLVGVECGLKEPGAPGYQTLKRWSKPSFPLKEDTDERFLAITGEYVLNLDLYICDSDGNRTGETFNRRLVSLYTFSQDAVVINAGILLVGGLIGGVIGFVLG